MEVGPLTSQPRRTIDSSVRCVAAKNGVGSGKSQITNRHTHPFDKRRQRECPWWWKTNSVSRSFALASLPTFLMVLGLYSSSIAYVEKAFVICPQGKSHELACKTKAAVAVRIR